MSRTKREPLRIRLTQTHSIPEIEQMIKDLEGDPDSKQGAAGLSIYNMRTLKKLDEMGWAIYSLSKKDKPEYIRKTSSPDMKYW